MLSWLALVCAGDRLVTPLTVYTFLAVYELKGVGLDGKVKLFQKPWAMTTTMFIGECSRCPCVITPADVRHL